jgi:hypothetical protein
MNLRTLAAAALAALPLAAAAQTAPAEAAPPAAQPQAVAPAPPPVAPPPQALPPPPPAAPVVVAQPKQSRWRGSFTVGAGTSYGETYFMAGARIGYILTHGLAAELEGQYWMGATPEIGKIAPGITWYSPYRVYAGAYYARWLVGSGYPDQDALGARAGVSLTSKGPASVGVGIAYEHALSCSRDCDAWWPEASVGVRF